jgi:phosphoribosyl 1,2-cyclic phosphate phosphodiesterase
MEVLFLGTGGAWGLPEHQCPCATCAHLRGIGESRMRTSLWLEGAARLLIDPGPDLRAQLTAHDLPRPDAVLITHEHHDHYLGLDELLCYRRNLPPDQWRPIPTYAHPAAWPEIDKRFGYLIPSLLEKRLAQPGQELQGGPFGPDLSCVPVKTYHGPVPQGSQGYVITDRSGEESFRLGYTSDMIRVEAPTAFTDLDLLVCQCHFLSEPQENRPHHLSLQRALPMLKQWAPRRLAFVHLSCQDHIPGDEAANAILKKYPPGQPLADPQGRPYAVPRDQASWQETVIMALRDAGLDMAALVAWDGLRLNLG